MLPTPTAPSQVHSCAAGTHLAQQVREDQLDSAIGAGLMDFRICDLCAADVAGVVSAAQQRLLQAWAARARYLVRATRLAARAQSRAARRTAAEVGSKPALPAAAQAALDRARARALGGNGK